MSRIIYAEDEDIKLSIEVIDGMLFVHVVLNKFSKAVLSKLRVAWDHLQTASFFDGWEEIFTYTRDPRIVELIGGAEEIGNDSPDLINTGYRMYKWDLTQ